MTRNDLNRKLTTETFEYGNHEISVNIRLVHKYKSKHFPGVIDGSGDTRYWHMVTVNATHIDTGDIDATKRTYAAADREPAIIDLPLLGPTRFGPRSISIPEQVENTVRSVFDTLDEIYKYTTADMDVDIEVAVDRVEHDISWVEVEDDLDRLLQEVDEYAE